MNLIQATTSVEFASVLLDAWDRADISGLCSHLANSEGVCSSTSNSSSLEGERCDLVNGIAAGLRQGLTREPDARVVDEMETSVQLLRHLVRMSLSSSS